MAVEMIQEVLDGMYYVDRLDVEENKVWVSVEGDEEKSLYLYEGSRGYYFIFNGHYVYVNK